MKPSVGRIVHYVDGVTCYAAIITKVVSDENVHLVIFPPPDSGFGNASVELSGGIRRSDTPIHDMWHWPERTA